MNQLQYITEAINKYPDQQVVFEDPLQIKLSPHNMPFTAWGIWQGVDGVYVLDGGGEWHGPLLESQVNSEYMINSLYQRMRLLPPPVSVVVACYDENVNATIFE